MPVIKMMHIAATCELVMGAWSSVFAGIEIFRMVSSGKSLILLWLVIPMAIFGLGIFIAGICFFRKKSSLQLYFLFLSLLVVYFAG